MVPDDVELRWLRTNIPLMAHDTPGGADAIRAMLPDELGAGARPARAAASRRTLWWGELTYLQPGLPPAQTRYLTFALSSPTASGRLGDPLPAGRARQHRLADHARQPGHVRPHGGAAAPGPPRDGDPVRRHPGLGDLARHLSSQRWFELIRDFSTEADHAAISRAGIVGRHAGDGMTAFFLAEHAGSRAAACAAALEAGREIVDWRPPGMERGELKINAGVHWGGALYLGQVDHRRPARGDRARRRGQRVRAHPADRARRRAARLQAAGRAARPRARGGVRARPAAPSRTARSASSRA